MDAGSIVAATILAIAWVSGPAGLLVAATALLNFGALAALPPRLTGGVTLTAASTGYALFVLSLAVRGGSKAILDVARDPRRLGWLSWFTAWSILATLIMPGLFAGEIDTYPIRSSGPVSVPAPIGYSASNATQIAYLALSYGISVGVAVAAAQPDFDRTFRRMVLALAALLVASGVLDLLGLNAILAPFRNASYALYADSAVGSAKRVVGAMPEASAFGGATASVFAILLLFRHRLGPGWPWMVCTGGTGILALLSTSSTAYAMMLGAGLAFAIQAALRFLSGSEPEHVASGHEIVLAAGCGACAVLLVLWSDDLRAVVGGLVDEIVLRKAASSSFEERARWTDAGLQAFLASGGLGIGAGSARTSNGFVNILASTGCIGVFLFALFLAVILCSPSPASARGDIRAARLALIPNAVGFLLAGTTPDYGPVTAILFGFAAHLVGGRRAS